MTTSKPIASAKAKPVPNDAIAMLDVFPKAKASSLDMVELGARMAARKDELLALAA
jgi:hypothetical protein